MLLAAQRARSPGGGLGVNVAGFIHGPGASAILTKDARIAFETILPRTLVLTMPALVGPGNTVVSFLDVAFPDELPARVVAPLLTRLIGDWRTGTSPVIWTVGPVAAHFYANPERDDALELRELQAVLLRVVGHVVPTMRNELPIAVAPPTPFRILRWQGPQGARYTLETDARTKLAGLTGNVLPQSFGIADETLNDFRAFALGPIEQVVVEALTTLPIETVDALGGASIVDATTGAEFWVTPAMRKP